MASNEQVTVTEKAAEMVIDYAGRENADPVLRVGLKGGGCSGYRYQLAFDIERDGDLTFQTHGITVLVARDHLPYLKGSTVDYVEGLMGAGFDVSNPNAVASCGCGDSFRVDHDDPSCGPSPEDVYL